MTMITNRIPKHDGTTPRVFLAFEDRGRDTSGLLEFGTVIQIFPTQTSWQLTSETTGEFRAAIDTFLSLAEFHDDDYVVAMGDPIAIAILLEVAGRGIAEGALKVLRWTRLPCPSCGRYKDSRCKTHVLQGRYGLVLV